MQGKSGSSAQKIAVQQVVNLRGSRFPSLKQWKELPRYLSAQEKVITRIALGLFIVSTVTLGTHTLFSTINTVPAIGGSYTEGALGTPQYINPLYATGSDIDADFTRLIYSGLLRNDGANGIVPDLADHYAVSDDQKTYTFTLRPNIFWHDGEKLTSADVIFTIDAIQNPEYHSPLAMSFAGTTVSAPDDSTIVFTLDTPFAPFLAALTVGILPAHLWEDVAPQSAPLAQYNIKPIGSGPFLFSKLVKDGKGSLKSITIARNPQFYRGTVYLNDITMKFYGSLQELGDAVRNKNVEGASVLSAVDAQSLKDDHVIALGAPKLSQFTAVFFNQKQNALFADDAVRKALNLATDRTAVTQKAVGAFGTPIFSPILSDMPGADTNTVVPHPDPVAASTLLESKEWVKSNGAAVRSKKDVSLAFSITTLDVPDLTAAANELATEWKAIGADVTVTAVDQTTLQNDVLKNRHYDVLLTGERYGAYPDLYPFWHSSQITSPGLNLGDFVNRKVDTAIEEARATADATKSIAASQLLATTFTDTIPAIMLYQPSYLYGLSPKLHSTEVTNVTTPSDRFANVEQWYRNTKRTW